MTPPELACLYRLTDLALAEDLGTIGDITSQLTIPAEALGRAKLIARTEGILAGVHAGQAVCERVDTRLRFQAHLEDGCRLSRGQEIAEIQGPMRSLLTAERTALNFMQRLSGIATLTRQYAEQVADLSVQLLDTRKTTPGWRRIEKYAVRMGGGTNHRLGLFDGILIKDNHLAALAATPRGLWPELADRVASMKRDYPHLPVEIEVDSLEQLQQVLPMHPAIVLLDNMGPDLLRQAVLIRNQLAPAVRLEASGGVTLQTLRGIAETGVDRISIGALTHSARALDIALDYQEQSPR